MVKRKKNKGTNNDLQNTTQETAERAPQTPLKSGDELVCSGSAKVPKSCPPISTKRTITSDLVILLYYIIKHESNGTLIANVMN
jgi:hypothetical protein